MILIIDVSVPLWNQINKDMKRKRKDLGLHPLLWCVWEATDISLSHGCFSLALSLKPKTQPQVIM